MAFFKDRTDAGKQLANALKEYKNNPNLIVIGLPTSMEPAYEVAQELGCRLDVYVPKEIQVPQKPDIIAGAVTDDTIVLDELTLEKHGFQPEDIVQQVKLQQGDSRSCLKRYRGDNRRANPTNNTIILVDDGNAQPVMVRAVLSSLRKQKPKEIIFACPVVCDQVAQFCDSLCDEIVSLHEVAKMHEIYDCYEEFTPQEEAQVHALIQKNRESLPN